MLQTYFKQLSNVGLDCPYSVNDKESLDMVMW